MNMSKAKYTQAEQETAYAHIEPWDELALYRVTKLGLDDLEKVPTVAMAFGAFLLDTAKVKTLEEYLSMELEALSDLFESGSPDEDPKEDADTNSADTEN